MRLVAVVTGAGGAMGEACAHVISPTVDALVVTDLNGGRLATVAARLRAEYAVDVIEHVGDIGDRNVVVALADVVTNLGDFKTLIHTAGLSPAMADWREIVRVDLCAVALLLDAFRGIAARGSVAVCIASVSAHMGDFDDAVDELLDDPLANDLLSRLPELLGTEPDAGNAYRLAKRAVVRLCERQAVAWGSKGGRVVSVSPGLIDTPMGRFELEHQPIKQWLAATTPVGAGRGDDSTPLPGRVDDIAGAVAFACSDQAAFLSGCDLLVDGGLLAALRQRS